MRISDIARKLVYTLSLLALLCFTGACKKKRDVSALPYVASLGQLAPDAVGVVVTTSVEGYIEPCGCTSDPLGGIARFAMMFNDLKTALKNNIALVDAGNLLFDAPTRIEADRCQDEKRIEVLLSSLSSLGLSTTVAGPLDNARGLDFRNRTYQQHKIKALDSLVTAADPLTAVHEVKTPSAKIAVVAVSLPPDAANPKLDEHMQRIKKAGFSTIIALSQMPVSKTKEVFANVSSVDIVIQGQTEAVKPTAPARLGERGPWLFEGGRQGQYFSMLVFQNLDKRQENALAFDMRGADRFNRESLLLSRIVALQKQAETAPMSRQSFLKDMITRAKNEIAELKQTPAPPPLSHAHFIFHQIPITKKIESDGVTKEKLEDYEKSVPLLVKKCEEGIVCPKAGPDEASYVGAEVCKSCHQEAFNVWKGSIHAAKGTDESGKEFTRYVGHSRAWKTLVDEGKDTDRSCIGCHSIGFMEKGGYCKAYDVDFRKDVQCESCHGAGSLHAQSGGNKKFIKREVAEATCRECHQVPHIPSFESFNYEERLMKILGKGHGENLLKQLTHRAKNSSG